mmetsp:Transcript_41762/g.100476  ORF Transcript_41762/g.100476 Transcript_41762/m.100476 type:complete len:93 (+) Transcript_41762:152-430(+)
MCSDLAAKRCVRARHRSMSLMSVGNHGLCPAIHGAEVDVHRARTAEGALPAAMSDAFHSLLEMDPWIWNSSVTRSETFRKAFPSPVSDRPNR